MTPVVDLIKIKVPLSTLSVRLRVGGPKRLISIRYSIRINNCIKTCVNVSKRQKKIGYFFTT